MAQLLVSLFRGDAVERGAVHGVDEALDLVQALRHRGRLLEFLWDGSDFTLTHRPLSMPVSNLGRTQCSRISRFARTDVNGMAYSLSAFLIAQIGKNRNVEQGRLISGAKLLELAKDAIRVAQERIGGQVVFLEMEQGNAKLAKFYADNGFIPFGTRDDIENGKSVTYDQLFLFLK